jgi:dienelactone hydrolase
MMARERSRNRTAPTVIVAAAALCIALSTSALRAQSAQKIAFPPVGPAASPGAKLPASIPGTLKLPAKAAGRVPAVLILHASNGLMPGGPEEEYVAALDSAGFATLVIDMWTPRGIPSGPDAFGAKGGPDRRPPTGMDNLPDAFGALKFLSEHPSIDPARIGVMGFSWGAALSFDSVVEPLAARALGAGPRFAAHAPHYMACWLRLPPHPASRAANAPWTGAPVLLQVAGRDDYDDSDGGANCRRFVDNLPSDKKPKIELVVYADATHSWNAKLRAPITVIDRHSHQGKGGKVRIEPNAKITAQAREATVAFFRKAFAN